MKKPLLILLFGLSSILTGCMTTEEIQMRNASKCSGYGFKAGTNAFAQCMMQLEKDDEKASDCATAALAAYGAAKPGQESLEMSRARADCQAGRAPRQKRSVTCKRVGVETKCTED